MVQHKHGISNNTLASLAIMLIIVSSMNLVIAFNIIQSRQTAAVAAAAGQVSLCSSFTPNITAATLHNLTEDVYYYYDVNLTEKESLAVYIDDTSMFDIDPNTGEISFTPTNADTGMHNVTILANETVCNYFQDAEVLTFNVSGANDAPFLVSIYMTNESSGSTNSTYYFQTPDPKFIPGGVELWEDVWYNLSLIADDPDLIFGDVLDYGTADPTFFVIDSNTGNAPQFSPTQGEVGIHMIMFYVLDQDMEIDQSANVSFQVHNVNDAPVMQNKTGLPGGLGANSLKWGGQFYYDINATDEDGDPLSYYVNILPNCTKLNVSDTNCSIFTIDLSTGIIIYNAPFADVGNYTVNYSVTDGNAWDWFLGSFSVTEFQNNPPNITAWHPPTPSVTMSEGATILFNITVVDDYGIPFAQWFKNNVLLTGWGGLCYNQTSNITYWASSTDSGIHNITVRVSDGQFVVSHSWELIVLNVEPIRTPQLGPPYTPVVHVCKENWRCTVFSTCSKENVEIRICVDLNNCSTSLNKPGESRYCTYTPDPTCYDSIRNCHEGSCEILTDCGGPCPLCPTCSDGIKNCHVSGECEEQIDCGGPCPVCPEVPKVAMCGNGICEAGELYDCMEDCLGFWIDTAIFILILILLIIVSILLYVYKKETVLLYVYRRIRGE